MTRFRPCIDLHQGKVKQIVGGSLRDEKNRVPVPSNIRDGTITMIDVKTPPR